MKRSYILINLFFLLTPVFAQNNTQAVTKVSVEMQSKPPQVLKGQNLGHYLRTYFNVQETLQKKSSKVADGKKWQVIYVMNATDSSTKGSYLTWGAVDDSRKEIENQIRLGNISRAVLLYSRPDGTTYMDVFPRVTDVRTKAINYSDTPEIQYTKIDTKGVSEQEILKQLFSGFSSKGYYTAVILNMHGFGKTMTSFIGGAHDIYPSTYIKPIRESGLVVNLLAWNSCLMGTIGNIYEMAAYTNVEYIITSSNPALAPQRVGSGKEAGSRGAHALLKLLGDNTPEMVARKFVAEFSVKVQLFIPDAKGNVHYATNAMLVDAKFFRKQVSPSLEKLLNEFGAKKLLIFSQTQGKDLESFNQMLRRINSSLKRKEREGGASNHSGQSKERLRVLQEVIPALLKNARQSILEYRCKEIFSGKVYKSPEEIPNNSDCIDGFSVDLPALQKLGSYAARKQAKQQAAQQKVWQGIQQSLRKPAAGGGEKPKPKKR